MKILSLKEFNPEWMRSRFFLLNLPTELVISDWTKIPRLDCVYAYRLSYKEFPCKTVKGETWTANYQQIAIEVHENFGDDGHTEYSLRDKFVILYEDELPKNFEEYRKLLDKVWEYEREIRDKNEQETFFYHPRYKFNHYY